MRLPIVRFNLGMIMFAIAGIAILIVDPIFERHGPSDYESAVVIKVKDGDADAIAREVLSRAVLDDALHHSIRGDFHLSWMARYRASTDPQAEMRRLITVVASPDTVRISMLGSDYADDRITVEAVAGACVRAIGPGRVALPGRVELVRRKSWVDVHLPMVLWLAWISYLSHWIRARRRASAAATDAAMKERLRSDGIGADPASDPLLSPPR
jgi:hypothetical protein